MKFDFFTLGGRFFWEDVFNYQGWVIQRNVRTKKHRLLDANNIRRESGHFTDCQETLLKYIEACELNHPYKDSVILLHNFGCTKKSWNNLIPALTQMKANIIPLNYASFYKSLNYQADLLTLFFKNLQNRGKLYFITSGAGGLVLRKFLANSNNFRLYNIARILEINPLNSGSDLAELIGKKEFMRNLFGPMLTDITPQKTLSLPKFPKEIPHGIIFYPPSYALLLKKLMQRFESFPPLSPPSERSYADDILTIEKYIFSPLKDAELGEICRQYLQTGNFPKLATNTQEEEK